MSPVRIDQVHFSFRQSMSRIFASVLPAALVSAVSRYCAAGCWRRLHLVACCCSEACPCSSVACCCYSVASRLRLHCSRLAASPSISFGRRRLKIQIAGLGSFLSFHMGSYFLPPFNFANCQGGLGLDVGRLIAAPHLASAIHQGTARVLEGHQPSLKSPRLRLPSSTSKTYNWIQAPTSWQGYSNNLKAAPTNWVQDDFQMPLTQPTAARRPLRSDHTLHRELVPAEKLLDDLHNLSAHSP